MQVTGSIRARCPVCGAAQDCPLVQSLDARVHPDAKQRLLSGELNVLACECGARSTLEATVLYRDPDAEYTCQVVPGGEAAMVQAVEVFRSSGIGGTQRLVPSLNALVEKVKLLDAGLDDRAIEMAKVLLLASRGDGELGRIMLFHAREDGVLRWILLDDAGEARLMASPLSSYARLAERVELQPQPTELRIDRAWAVDEVRAMIAGAS
jgi:hypothetical protein